MSLFEFTFGLSAVILGLALAHMASTVSKLAMAGRRVRWAPEPVLLAALVTLIVVSTWLFQWGTRDQTETTYGLMMLQVGKLILPFMAATFVLPDPIPEEGPVDLYAHYDRTRALSFGALIGYMVVLYLVYAVTWTPAQKLEAWPTTLRELVVNLPWECLAYGALIVVRRRWVNIGLLSALLLYNAWFIVPIRLEG
ncbi:MAG: hypothetical protein EON89_05730 [Brevundimonas sp.]|nr:MAG: hypothetical protein EON89_05730 [Brevundimonas sp.]